MSYDVERGSDSLNERKERTKGRNERMNGREAHELSGAYRLKIKVR